MIAPAPSAEKQLRFLQQVQLLLEEGSFVSTYKFSLLQALADLAVEKGDVGGEALKLDSREIAGKMIEGYWRQVVPYPSRDGAPGVLLQNADRQAAIVEAVREARQRAEGSLSRARADRPGWAELVRRVTGTVRTMPLWKLQTVRHGINDFLYPNVGRGQFVELRPGVAFCLRVFHGPIRNMVQGAWVRWIRRLGRNAALLGQSADLHEFLFGTERAPLSVYVPLLRELQRGECFYCHSPLKGTGEVDHFVPWVRYPLDLSHNFVLAHRLCNADKSDLLAAAGHLASWVRRNGEQGAAIDQFCQEQGLASSLEATIAVAKWAYEQVERVGGSVWVGRGQNPVTLGPGWREAAGLAAA